MIHLGFEIESGNPVLVPEGHTIFLGQTQLSGKTTAQAALATRSGYACLAFETKRHEEAFHLIPKPLLHSAAPYYREDVDWHNVRDLCEAVTDENWDKKDRRALRSVCRKGKFGRQGSKLFTQWPEPKTMEDVVRNLEIALEGARGNREEILGAIHDDLCDALEDIAHLNKKCKVPNLKLGLNVLNLVGEPEHIQATVVASMIRWVLENRRHTVISLPETWKFTDARKRTAVGQAARRYIREGAAGKNFLWIDSQTISGLSGELLGQCQVWLFGVQKWSKELEHALNTMPDHYWPERSDIQTLGKGEFLVCFGKVMHRVYVQPAWMNYTHAQAIARREVQVESAEEIARAFAMQQRVSP